MMPALLGVAVMASVMGSVGADSRPLTGQLDGDHLAVRLADGTLCEGSIEKMGDQGGLGSLRCDDGRSGSFGWTYLGRDQATGDGWLAGESLTLTFTKAETRTQF